MAATSSARKGMERTDTAKRRDGFTPPRLFRFPRLSTGPASGQAEAAPKPDQRAASAPAISARLLAMP